MLEMLEHCVRPAFEKNTQVIFSERFSKRVNFYAVLGDAVWVCDLFFFECRTHPCSHFEHRAQKLPKVPDQRSQKFLTKDIKNISSELQNSLLLGALVSYFWEICWGALGTLVRWIWRCVFFWALDFDDGFWWSKSDFICVFKDALSAGTFSFSFRM